MSEDRDRLLADLNQHPAWLELKAWTREQRDGYLKNLAQVIFEGRPLAESDLDYKRGFFKGMNLLMNQPFFSAAVLRREIERKEVNQ